MKFYRAAGTAHWTPGALPEGMEPCVREIGSWSPPELESPNEKDQINTSLTYGFVFDYCGIEIDRDTGAVKIDKYVTTHDSGKILNPLIADGQVYGAFAWGVGCALYEEFVYGEDGSFKSGTFADYLVPTSSEVPEPQIIHMESPSMVTPLGAKGIAEGNCMSTPVCIANAVADATGENNLTLPLIASKVASIIHGEEPAAPSEGKEDSSRKDQRKQKIRKDGLLRGEGKTIVPATPEKVWETLLDPKALAAVIPGCHELEVLGDYTYRAEVSLGVGPVRGRFRANVSLSNMIEPVSATLSGGLEGPLGASKGSGDVKLEIHDRGTEVSYKYAIELSGTVASVGGRMLQGAAKALVGQFFQRLAGQISGVKTKHNAFVIVTNIWELVLRMLRLKP